MLVRHREFAALDSLAWWWFVHLRSQGDEIVFTGSAARCHSAMVLAEVAGRSPGPGSSFAPIARGGSSHRSAARHGAPGAHVQPVGVARGRPAAVGGDPDPQSPRDAGRGAAGARGSDYPADRFEAVVVLDGCIDGSAELARSLELPFRCVWSNRNGWGPLRRAGIAALRRRQSGPPLSGRRRRSRIRLCSPFHARAHRLAKEDHAALGYCPPFIEGTSPWELMLRAWWEDHYRRRAEPDHHWTYTDFASANSSLSRAIFLEHGFDETFAGRGREDWELGFRLLETACDSPTTHGEGVALPRHAVHDCAPPAARGGRLGRSLRAQAPGGHESASGRSVLLVVDESGSTRTSCAPPRIPRGTHAGPTLGCRDSTCSPDFTFADAGAGRPVPPPPRVRARARRRAHNRGASERACGDHLRLGRDASSQPRRRESGRHPTGAQIFDLEIAAAGSVLGKVSVVDPGGQWDWQAVTNESSTGLETTRAKPCDRRARGCRFGTTRFQVVAREAGGPWQLSRWTSSSPAAERCRQFRTDTTRSGFSYVCSDGRSPL